MENKLKVPPKMSRLLPQAPRNKNTNILKEASNISNPGLKKPNAIPSRIGLKRRSKSFSDLPTAKKMDLAARKPHSFEYPILNKKPVAPTNPVTVWRPVVPASSTSTSRLINNKRPAPEKKTEAVKPKVARPMKPAPYDYKARYTLENEKNMKHVAELKVLKKDLADITNERTNYKKELDELQQTYNICKKNLDKLEEESRTFKTDLAETKHKLELVLSENENYVQKIESYTNQLKESEDLRRVLHNAVQDLKGNIRVFCRVRPGKEDEEFRMPCSMIFLDETMFEIKKAKESISCMNGKPTDLKLEFSFDRVFPPDSTQEEVFQDLSQLVQSALDGYNVCVFAYGQTGSGKTYTMQGNEKNPGMIPRSIELLFDQIMKLENAGWTYEVQVSFLEVYNETIRDLLDPNNKNTKEIRYNDGKGATVTNLRVETVTCAAAIKKLMFIAQSNRAVAATNFNEHSSRSHSVTQITLQGYHSQSADCFRGSINLVDLAGSENAKNSDRITETKNINKSLSTLGNVMLALHNNESHIPYRNSKLTYLLQSCLGGNSKTLMFVNISPFEDCFNETVNSLRFAAKVKEVKTGSKRNRGVKYI